MAAGRTPRTTTVSVQAGKPGGLAQVLGGRASRRIGVSLRHCAVSTAFGHLIPQERCGGGWQKISDGFLSLVAWCYLPCSVPGWLRVPQRRKVSSEHGTPALAHSDPPSHVPLPSRPPAPSPSTPHWVRPFPRTSPSHPSHLCCPAEACAATSALESLP